MGIRYAEVFHVQIIICSKRTNLKIHQLDSDGA